jgi:uncharacterized protein (TIGR01777 family)
MLGREVMMVLRAAGHEPRPMVRRAASADEISWDPQAGTVDDEALASFVPEGAVHLAGSPVDQRWSKAGKERILKSRTTGTTALAEALARLQPPPQVLVCASAVGYYGDGGERELTEESARGEGFLADVVDAWEGAADPARDAGIRTVHLRFGTLQSREGGALKKLLRPFQLGLGGPIGPGGNYVSCVSRADAARAVLFALEEHGASGPLNVSLPNPVTQREYAKALGRVLHRPAVLPAPGLALRAALGQLAEEMLLVSQRVVPAGLTELGFQFVHPDVESAIRSGIDSSK